jgi:acyl carrier protein
MNTIVDFIINTLITKSQVPPETVTADSTFESLALDSLVFIELEAILAGRFGVEFDDGELKAERTIRGAAALVEARSARFGASERA